MSICSDPILCPGGNCVGCKNGQLYCNDPRCFPNCKNCSGNEVETYFTWNRILLFIILILAVIVAIIVIVIIINSRKENIPTIGVFSTVESAENIDMIQNIPTQLETDVMDRPVYVTTPEMLSDPNISKVPISTFQNTIPTNMNLMVNNPNLTYTIARNGKIPCTKVFRV